MSKLIIALVAVSAIVALLSLQTAPVQAFEETKIPA